MINEYFLSLQARRDADDQAKSRYANLEANSDPRSNVQIQEAQNAKDSVLKQDPHSTHNPVSKANTKASTQNSGRSTRVSGQALGSSPTLGFVMEDNQQEKRTAGQQSPMQISEGKKNGKITQTKKQSSDLKKLASPALNGISKNEPGEKTPSRFGIENGATKSGGAIKKASKAQSQSKSQSSRQKKASQGIEINGHHCPGLPNIVNSPNRDMSSPRLIISPRSRTPKNGSTLAPKPYQKSPLNPQDTLEDRIKQNDGVALRSDPPDLSHLELDDQREILDGESSFFNPVQFLHYITVIIAAWNSNKYNLILFPSFVSRFIKCWVFKKIKLAKPLDIHLWGFKVKIVFASCPLQN